MQANQTTDVPMSLDPKYVSRLLTRYVEELRDLGLKDHRWVLIALGDIADYCRDHDMTRSGDRIDAVILDVEQQILGAANTAKTMH